MSIISRVHLKRRSCRAIRLSMRLTQFHCTSSVLPTAWHFFRFTRVCFSFCLVLKIIFKIIRNNQISIRSIHKSKLIQISHPAGLRSFQADWISKSFLAREYFGIDLMFFLSGFIMFITLFEKVKNRQTNILKLVLFWVISKRMN